MTCSINSLEPVSQHIGFFLRQTGFESLAEIADDRPMIKLHQQKVLIIVLVQILRGGLEHSGIRLAFPLVIPGPQPGIGDKKFVRCLQSIEIAVCPPISHHHPGVVLRNLRPCRQGRRGGFRRQMSENQFNCLAHGENQEADAG